MKIRQAKKILNRRYPDPYRKPSEQGPYTDEQIILAGVVMHRSFAREMKARPGVARMDLRCKWGRCRKATVRA